MNIYDAIKEKLNLALTEKGDKAYLSTTNYNYDLIASLGAIRGNDDLIIKRFLLAFNEDRVKSIKVLFYCRDIISGLGERDTFRQLLSLIGNMMPGIAKKLLPYIKDYGRFDDYLVLLESPIANDVSTFLKKILEKDLKSKKEISLLSKWLPSINTSNSQARKYARILASKWGYSYQEYRLNLSQLRKKGKVLETYLTSKDFSFDYSGIPGQAFLKYMNCFEEKDKERYEKYIEDVRNKQAKLHTSTIQAHQLTKAVSKSNLSESATSVLNLTFEDLVEKYPNIDSSTIVVRDGSGSMYGTGKNGITPIDIADSLSIFFASKIQGVLNNCFITFSEVAELVKLPNNATFDKKVEILKEYNAAANTNIENVLNLLYDLAVDKKIDKNQMIKRVVIISDMEFDAPSYGASNLDNFIEKFEKIGLTMPQIIFWCVESRNETFPSVFSNGNCLIISGYSQNILKGIVEAGTIDIDVDDLINNLLKKYDFVEKLGI